MKKTFLTLAGLTTFFTSTALPSKAEAKSCVRVPKTVVSEAINSSFYYAKPHIHLNQVHPVGVQKKWKRIYLPNDNWIKVSGQKYSLGNFNPYYRLRRSHYLMDFNSRSFKVSAPRLRKGLKLRVEFETDGNEIKGWCHKCRIKRRRDRAAADMNIEGKSGKYPAVEAVFDLSFSNGKSRVSLSQAKADMKVDGRGFLELFDGLISRKVTSKVEQSIMKSWDRSSGIFEQRLNSALGRRLNFRGNSFSVDSINFGRRYAQVCVR